MMASSISSVKPFSVERGSSKKDSFPCNTTCAKEPDAPPDQHSHQTGKPIKAQQHQFVCLAEGKKLRIQAFLASVRVRLC